MTVHFSLVLFTKALAADSKRRRVISGFEPESKSYPLFIIGTLSANVPLTFHGISSSLVYHFAKRLSRTLKVLTLTKASKLFIDLNPIRRLTQA